MQSLAKARLRIVLCVSFCLLVASPLAAQDWQTSAANAQRDRTVSAPPPGPVLSPIWRIPTFGLPDSAFVADIDADPETEIVLTVGGRARAFRTDGSTEWLSNPEDLAALLAVADLNADGQPELIFSRKTSGFAVLRGRDGKLLFATSPADLATLGLVLLRDLDNDGIPELLATEIDAGGPSRQVGRSIIYNFSDLESPTEVARLQESARDYNNGRSLVFANLDGQGEPEVVAIGNRFAYVYSPSTGALLQRSEDLGSVPFGVGAVFVSDITGDGDDEVMLVTNNPYAASVNSRRLTLLDVNAEGVLSPVWTVSVENVSTDLHVWPAQGPFIDLDADGQPEVVHGFYNAASQTWSTFIRDPLTGDPLATLQGRLSGVAAIDATPHLLLTQSPEGPLRSFAWSPGGPVQGPDIPGDTLIYQTLSARLPSGAAVVAPLTDGSALFTLSRFSSSGALTPTPVLWRADPGLSETSFPYAPSDLFAFDTQAAPTTIVHVAPSGDLTALNLSLQAVSPPATSALAIRSPSANLSDPLLLAFNPVAGVLHAARAQALFDADLANLASPASARPLLHTVLSSADIDLDTQPDWIVLDTAAITERADLLAIRHDQTPLWSRDNLVSSQQTRAVVYNRPHVAPDLNGDAIPDILLQTSVSSEDTLYLDLLSGADGSSLWASPASATPFASGGTAWPLALLGPSPKIALMRAGLFSLHDAASGGVLSTTPSLAIYGSLSADINGDGAQNLLSSAQIFGRWYAIDQSGATLWQQLTISTETSNARYTGSGASLVQSPQGRFLVEGRVARLPFDHNLVVLDATTGSILHRLALSGGQVAVADPANPAQRSIGPGIGLSGARAHFIASDDQGFVYVLDLEASSADPDYPQNMLVSAFFAGAPADNISAADIDGDDALEVAVPTGDGYILILDTPDTSVTIDVSDTRCPLLSGDIDESDATSRFCGAWTTQGPPQDGFVVELIDAESRARIAGPTATTVQEILFKNINLSIGSRYLLRVQSYTGQGASARASLPFDSDGVTIIDLLIPPDISLTASPDQIIQDQEFSDIHWYIFDSSPLSAYRVTITDPLGNIVFEDGTPLNTTEIDMSLAWYGRDADDQPLPLGVYTVTVSADDFSGLTSSAQATVEIILPLPDDISEESDATDTFEPPDTTEDDASDSPDPEDGVEDAPPDFFWDEGDSEAPDTEPHDTFADGQTTHEDTNPPLDTGGNTSHVDATSQPEELTSIGEEGIPADCSCATTNTQPRAPGVAATLGVAFGLWAAFRGRRRRNPTR